MRNGESIYLCKRTSDEGADIITYGDPIEYGLRFGYMTCQPTNGRYSTVEYGEKLSNGWTITANAQIFYNTFKAGDKIYVDGKLPVSGEVNGKTANAIVSSVLKQNRLVVIMCEYIEGM